MAITFFPTDHLSVDVDDPGYGNVVVCFEPDDEERQGRRQQSTLRGRDMWRALQSLTELACRGPLDPAYGAVDRLWTMTVGDAKVLLPALQGAILYAAAGTDRAERITADEEESHDLLCARGACNEGSMFSPDLGCEEYGHQPFGYGGNWERAQELADWDRQRAERARQRREFDEASKRLGASL